MAADVRLAVLGGARARSSVCASPLSTPPRATGRAVVAPAELLAAVAVAIVVGRSRG